MSYNMPLETFEGEFETTLGKARVTMGIYKMYREKRELRAAVVFDAPYVQGKQTYSVHASVSPDFRNKGELVGRAHLVNRKSGATPPWAWQDDKPEEYRRTATDVVWKLMKSHAPALGEAYVTPALEKAAEYEQAAAEIYKRVNELIEGA
jgi:hypothetical protein